MEWYLGQKSIHGFSAIPLSTACQNFCTANNNYSINCRVEQPVNDNNFKRITINVTNPGNATLSTTITNY
jgi:hypothetical protein